MSTLLGEMIRNVFCPTGPGGGIKPDCKGSSTGQVIRLSQMKRPDYFYNKQEFQTARDFFGDPNLSIEKFAKMVCAVKGAQINVRDNSDDPNTLEVLVRHPGMKADRMFVKDQDGLRAYNEDLAIFKTQEDGDPNPLKAPGTGSRLFHDQVKALQEAGFREILTVASSGYKKDMNGYYTWPRLGYDAKIPEGVNLPPELKAQVGDSQSIRDLMKTPEGRKWWRKNGETLTDARFDLTPGSESVQILEQYMAGGQT
jgi:hypothetical protein